MTMTQQSVKAMMTDLKEVLRMLRPARTCPKVNRLLLMDPVSLNAASPSFPVAYTTHSKQCQCHRLLLIDPVSNNAASPSFLVACTTQS